MKKILGLVFAITFLFVSLSAQVEAGKPYIGIHASGINLLGGDEPNQWKMWSGGQIGIYFSKRVGLELTASSGWSRSDPDPMDYITYLTPVSISMRFNFLKDKRIIPYASLGAGMLFWDLRNHAEDDYSLFAKKIGDSVYEDTDNYGFITAGLGFEFYLTRVVGLEIGFKYNNMITSEFREDMSGYGNEDEHEGVLEFRLGFNLHMASAKDTDNDGVLDKLDLDPLNPEDFDGFEDEDGAPDPDNDKDGILDADDKAPNEAEDMDGFQDKDGIPDPDNDGDKILDVNDASPNDAEDFDDFEDEDGTPDPDNDGDRILDANDGCPNEAETFNGFQDEDGCPDKKPEIVFEEKAPIILDGVTFASGSSELTMETKNVLGKVVRTLNDYPEMKLEINGYTDNTGSLKYNMKISKARAESVKTYLVNQGIKADRLTANGFGPENPMVSNSTKEGRAKNRRIEFFRVK